MKKPPHWNEVEEGGMLHCHFIPRLVETIKENAWRYKHIVIPLRHPVAIAISWRRRNQNLWDLEDEVLAMEEVLPHIDPFIFPMETAPCSALEAFLGRGVFPDVPPNRRGSNGNYEAKELWESGQVEKLKSLRHWRRAYKFGMKLLDISPMLRQYYGS